METLRDAFSDVIDRIVELSPGKTFITQDNVFQTGVKEALPLVDTVIGRLLLPGSCIKGLENITGLYKKAKSGAACLFLLEHYSNLDLSCFISLLRKAGAGEIADSTVSIAGMKLNEENSTVAAFAGIYTRIVICPSRTLQSMTVQNRDEVARAQSINLAAVKVMNKVKTDGKIILVFPSGTRYRPWDPSTKKAVREIDSYIKSFDYLCPVAINGEILHINGDASGDMLDDHVSKDVMVFSAGEVVTCEEFRNRALEEASQNEVVDKKQAVADAVMNRLAALHDAEETIRQAGNETP
jgi:glycerol-3-phosphate O-acyltransferase